ncbi:hypothetical protein AVEN_181263-1 [Araneus ventricosus]|uniref:Uncharacterized protein n=1 Tax=Araneus ventricosus TaxID=182803 RepID=A0A4Y2HM18_ARAVE|nr:hypothetical protein AVEN_68623-1 [Araneus ventricosus]GBM66084.1 hypothetical protein AVEN_85202-1 [Araneus ventricosus]GBM66101.1 hypothetical protein AVEN_171308-1 [Araneus ventricosus]GBM66123.1 hypothetical protein AVEN_181263-1 [Araneus ventricosus]
MELYSDRGGKNMLKMVNLKPVFWTREEILFATGHGPFPLFLNRFHLSDTDSCACGEVDDPIHYATSCPLTLSWHVRNPSTSLKVCGTKESWKIRIQEKE